MVKVLRSCLEAVKGRENQGRSLDPQKKPQENSYRIFYSLKYIPYTHSTCRIYSNLQRNPYSVWSKLSGVALKPPKGKSRRGA
jgi:hypothetical protein